MAQQENSDSANLHLILAVLYSCGDATPNYGEVARLAGIAGTSAVPDYKTA